MAGKKPPAEVEALALVDIPSIGAQCGRVFKADAATVAALVKDGQADDNAQAVKAAQQ